MSGRIDLLATLVAFGAALWLIACSDRKAPVGDEPLDGPFESPYSGQELADRIQSAIEVQGSYSLTVQQTNFVLPQWGGSDGGSVSVGRIDLKVAVNANLRRTGDGDYDIWLREGRTWFQRSTCPDPALMPGGGGRVLEPFVFLGNDRIRTAKGLQAASGRTALILSIEGIGDAEISFDPRTFLPHQLSSRTATNNGQPLVWTFEDWGKQPEASNPGFRDAVERGPGGNPC